MKIARNIAPGRDISIDLTAEEMEQVYEKVRHRKLMEAAEEQFGRFLDDCDMEETAIGTIMGGVMTEAEFLSLVTEEFTRKTEMGIANEKTWENAIEKTLAEKMMTHWLDTLTAIPGAMPFAKTPQATMEAMRNYVWQKEEDNE